MTSIANFLPGSHEAISLDHRGLISVASQNDAARTFLQGLVTCDMNAITPERAGFGALLTPQGKVLVDFIIAQTGDDAFLLDCSKAQSPGLFKRLKMFRLRAPIELQALDESHHALLIAPDNKAQAIADPRHEALGHRLYGTRAELDAYCLEQGISLVPTSHYQSLMMLTGIGEIDCGFGPEEMFLMDANYDRLNGVSYSKGCFVGQEVSSRMKRKGNIRKRTLRVTNFNQPLSAGDTVYVDATSVGSILDGDNVGALALIRIDRLHANLPASSGLAVLVGNENSAQQAMLETPDYLRESE